MADKAARKRQPKKPKIEFVQWLKRKLTKQYETRGYIHTGAGVWNLEFVKGDSKKLFDAMYYDLKNLCFEKKYFKVRDALLRDRTLGIDSLQK